MSLLINKESNEENRKKLDYYLGKIDIHDISFNKYSLKFLDKNLRIFKNYDINHDGDNIIKFKNKLIIKNTNALYNVFDKNEYDYNNKEELEKQISSDNKFIEDINEINIMSILNNEQIDFVSKLVSFNYSKKYITYTIEYIDNSYTLTDFLDMHNFELYKNILKLIFTYLGKLYNKYKFTHYDLHSNNILVYFVDKKIDVKIIDFGVSRMEYNGEIYGKDLIEYGVYKKNYFWIYDIYKLLNDINANYSDEITIKLLQYFNENITNEDSLDKDWRNMFYAVYPNDDLLSANYNDFYEYAIKTIESFNYND